MDRMQDYWKTSELEGENAAYLESLYESYLDDPDSVDAKWRNYFDSVKGEAGEEKHSAVREAFIELAKHPQISTGVQGGDAAEDLYRKKGHLLAKVDPLNLQKSPAFESLGLDKSLEAFKKIYCGTIGYEYMYIMDDKRRAWLVERIESGRKPLSAEQKKWLLEQLVAADGLEKYLGTRYVGQKRFSLEGGDGFIPLMSAVVEQAGRQNVKEIYIGMAHRGRLNTLVNIMGKPPRELFDDFEGKKPQTLIGGDEKYHEGFVADVEVAEKTVHLELAFNPSHLEIISLVVEGAVHARQKHYKQGQEEVFAIQVHGDAAISGQGCVYEELNMAQTRGFNNGGSVHIVINNQVGFTTSPADSRSTHYCTDIAKAFDAPVFHVNGNDPEAILSVAQLAVDYRNTFKKDVFIDLICYRRYGHNESDEPSGTQPLMYQVVKNMPAPAKLYKDQLVTEKMITEEDFTAMQQAYKQKLESGKPVINCVKPDKNITFSNWQPYQEKTWRESYKAKVSAKELTALSKKLAIIPKDFKVQTQVAKALQDREKMIAGEIPFNWGGAEILAYATLLNQGIAIRLSGEDSGRGTFSHRHSVIKDQENGQNYIPLNHLAEKQAQFDVVDSVLSEEGVLAFEYGHAGKCPEGLNIWEAQYGDFANGAQVVIDQFVSAAEEKWGTLNGLTLLLPHGQEGSGPEHASARLERYLQLCAHDNMQVCVPTTPAQIYHLLRRQVLRPYRKPLVIMSPKSLLRHPLVTSTLTDLTEGQFQPIIGEIDTLKAKKIRRVVFCQGKIYYELLTKRREQKREDIVIIRLEQIYPFPDSEIKALLKEYSHVQDWVWCQEEPYNQGAWFKVRDDFAVIDIQCRYVGRKAYAAPAVGYADLFKTEQESLVTEALAD